MKLAEGKEKTNWRIRNRRSGFSKLWEKWL